METRTNRQLESAGRTLAGALARLSVGELGDAAALLRCAAKYLEGVADAAPGETSNARLTRGDRGLVLRVLG